MERWNLSGILSAVVILAVVFTLAGVQHEFGPWLWYKRAAGRRRALTGKDRRQFVARVQRLLPQARDENVVFSLYRESRTRGTKVSITVHSYRYKVYVADRGRLWVIPMDYDTRTRAYTLGEPVLLPEHALRQVDVSGKRGKALTYKLLLENDGQVTEWEMVLAPLCFRRNAHDPFDMVQDTACAEVEKAVQRMARSACDLTPEDLENMRLKNESFLYGTYAACMGAMGLLLTPAGSVPAVAVWFVAAAAMLAVMLAKRQVPKLSALAVAAEAVAAYLILR